MTIYPTGNKKPLFRTGTNPSLRVSRKEHEQENTSKRLMCFTDRSQPASTLACDKNDGHRKMDS